MYKKVFLTGLISVILTVFMLGASMPSSALFSGHTNISERVIKKKIMSEAKKQGFCPYMALSVARQESEFKYDAKSPVGAIGVFQLMPETARDLEIDPQSVDENIKGGIKYLKMMKRQFGSDQLALAAYNAGPGTVQRYGGIPPYPETRHYVKNIMRFYKEYKKFPQTILAEL